MLVDRRRHQGRVGDGGQGDEGHAIANAGAESLDDRDGQARLAHTAGSRQRQEMDVRLFQQCAHGCQLMMATDQRRALRRQPRRRQVETASRDGHEWGRGDPGRG
jgi:hypothetical protein